MNEIILILMLLLGTSMVVDSTEAEAGGFDQSDVASLPVDRSGNLGGRVYDDAGNCHIAGTRYKTPCKTKLEEVVDAIECAEGIASDCVKAVDDVIKEINKTEKVK